jgi:hypothetical protein
MAELKLKTRLLNKMSEKQGAVADLRKGEINFYPATVTVDVEKQKQETYLVMEVGGTDKPFAAKASDVYEWAKAETKPKYKAGEIEGLSDYISGEIEDTNTKYSFEVDNGQIVIKYKEVKDENYKHLTAIDIITETELRAILDDYVTETELAEALSNFQTQLNLSQYATITYVDGEIDKVEAQITAVDKKVDGVSAVANAAAVKADVDAALDKKVDKEEGKSLISTSEIERLTTLKNYDDTTVKADIAANTKDITDEATARENADTALDTKITNLGTKTTEDIAAALQEAKNYANTNDADTKYGITYDSENKKIKLVEGGATAEIDASDFIKDGMISSVDLDDNTLVITWNTDSGITDTTRIDLEYLIDVYTAEDTNTIDMTVEGNKIKASVIEGSISEKELNASVNASLDKADSAVQNITTGSTNGTISVDGTEVSVAGLGSAAYKNATAFEAAGAVKALADGAVAENTAAISAINNADTGILAQAKAYANSLEHENTTYTAGAGLILNGTEFSIDIANTVFVLDANA